MLLCFKESVLAKLIRDEVAMTKIDDEKAVGTNEKTTNRKAEAIEVLTAEIRTVKGSATGTAHPNEVVKERMTLANL